MVETFVVLLTGRGRGAVASLLLIGPSAKKLIEDRFHPFQKNAFAKWQRNKPYFGNWTWNDYSEELVVCQTEAERFEIHCHGGRLASRQIVESLAAGGATEISQTDWLGRSQRDPFVSAANMLLLNATTERTAAIAMDQVRGAMRNQLLQVRTQIKNEQIQEANAALDRLLELGAVGVRLHRPFSVVLIGPPNTGKSSLINSIVGYQRSVVFDQPGTTRDLVRVETAIDGWPIRLTDTAGVRESSDRIEQEGIRLARETTKTADLAIVVCDLSDNQSAKLDLADNVASIRIGTKLDLASSESQDEISKRDLDAVTSAETGEGIDTLHQLITKNLVPTSPAPGEAIPLRSETVETVQATRQHLNCGEISEALHSIDALLA